MSKELKLELPGVDDLFTTEEERQSPDSERIREIPVDLIDDFPNHPFKIRYDDEMNKLIESIADHGVLIPVITRPKENGRYEMIAGHRRKIGALKAGNIVISGIVRNYTDDEAIIMMVDSNVQREHILPSEKAKAYKMKLEAIKRQGERRDLTSPQLGGKLKGKESTEIIGEKVGESKEQVRRYIRLNELIPEILNKVDNGEIAFTHAVELSYLSKTEQKYLFETIEIDEVKPSASQVTELKELSQRGQLNDETILDIMSRPKPNQVEQFKIPRKEISRFFKEDTPKEQIQETIIKALEMYQRKKERQMGAR